MNFSSIPQWNSMLQGLRNNELTELNLCGQPIGDKGAIEIAKALKGNQTLKKLNMRLCDVYERGALALAEALTQNSTLEELDLSKEPVYSGRICEEVGVGDVGAGFFLRALRVNKTVKSINLTHNNIQPELAEKIRQGGIIKIYSYEDDFGELPTPEPLENDSNTQNNELIRKIDDVINALYPNGTNSSENFYHQNTNRNEAERRLTNERVQGAFIIRQGSVVGSTAISYLSENSQVCHVLIKISDYVLEISNSKTHASLKDFFECHQAMLKNPLAVSKTPEQLERERQFLLGRGPHIWDSCLTTPRPADGPRLQVKQQSEPRSQWPARDSIYSQGLLDPSMPRPLNNYSQDLLTEPTTTRPLIHYSQDWLNTSGTGPSQIIFSPDLEENCKDNKTDT